jgi:CheY-specific phosphatase CheX
MDFGEKEILELSRNIWRQVLDLEITLDSSSAPLSTSFGLMTSCVQITGDWEGAVAIYCTSLFAQQAASIAFQSPIDEVSFEEMQDILGELANILGGNIKSLLPGSCALSLPSVVEGRDYRFGVLGSQLKSQIRLRCLEEPVHIAILQREDRPQRHSAPSA